MAGNRARLRLWLAVFLAAGCTLGPARTAHAGIGDVVGALGDIVGGVMALPLGILQGTFSGPPIIGTVSGAAFGAVQTIASTTRGVFRLVGTAVPTAAAYAPYVLPFLL